MTGLPEGWSAAQLGDIVPKVTKGTTPTTNGFAFVDHGINFIKIENLDLGEIDTRSIRQFISHEAHKSQDRSALAVDDILFSIAGTIGATAIVKASHLPANTNQALAILSGYTSAIAPKFLKLQLESFVARETISRARGGAMNNISLGDLKEANLVVPPLPEQDRIVSKIEELFSELDAGTASLTRARAQLKTYRQALLKAAFEGKLTAPWRAANPDKLESPETLLSRIRKERDARFAAALDDWQTALSEWRAGGEVGRKPGKPRRPDDAEPIGSDELMDLGELPREWAWARPVELASPKPYAIGIGPFGSNLKVSDYKREGIPLVFVKNITRRNFSLDLKYVTAAKASELEAHSAEPNDILITKMGDPPGDCAIYPVDAPRAIITADCLKFRVWDDFASRNYVAYCIESILVQRQLGLLIRGVAQKKISVDRFKTIALPLPSLPEQEEIASQLDAILSVVANQDSEITTALTRITALRQSILKKAFSGQLVPQNPADEPASALLARLAQAPAPKPRRKTKP